MKKEKRKLTMKLDRFKKISGEPAQKARSMGLLPKIGIMYRSGRIRWAVVLIFIVAWFANDHLVTRDVAPKCWFCSAGERATVEGVITKLDCIGYGAKNRNDYRVTYVYTVNGRSYSGIGYETGLLYLEKHPVTIDYLVQDPSCSCIREMRCAGDNALFTVLFGGPLLLAAFILILGGARRLARAVWIIEHGSPATATVRSVSERRVTAWYTRRFSRVTIRTASCAFNDTTGSKFGFEVNMPENALKKDDALTVVYDPGMPENVIAVDALPGFVKTVPPLAR